MEIEVAYFGLIAEATQKRKERLEMPATPTVNALSNHLRACYPGLGKTTFQVAINQAIALPETVIQNGDEVAILPPFAGG